MSRLGRETLIEACWIVSSWPGLLKRRQKTVRSGVRHSTLKAWPKSSGAVSECHTSTNRIALHLYKTSCMAKGQPPSGLVELTLVDVNQGREQDQRYPIRSYQTGEIIGEMRAAVVWRETLVHPRANSGGLINVG